MEGSLLGDEGGGGGEGGEGIFPCGKNEQIFCWWEGDMGSTRENHVYIHIIIHICQTIFQFLVTMFKGTDYTTISQNKIPCDIQNSKTKH